MPLRSPVPSLPGALSGRFDLGPVGCGDAPAVFELVRACDVAVLGYPDVSLEDIDHDTGPPAGGGERPQAAVRRSGTDELVGWWWSDPVPQSRRFFGAVYVDPALLQAEADLIAAAGWASVEGWARDFHAGGAAGVGSGLGADLVMATGVLDGDRDTERRVDAAGFERVRTFWRMTAPVPDSPAATGVVGPPVPADLAIVPATDTRVVHRLREETFADHWEHVPEPYDVWLARKTSEPGHDASMWFVAQVDGEPAGFMICSRQMANDDALYVATLGTPVAYRRRGVATALLNRSVKVARDAGFGSVRLGVDSESPTGAPAVYRKAGFEVLFAVNAWHKPLALGG